MRTRHLWYKISKMFINKVPITINIKYFNCCIHHFYTINIRHASAKTKPFEEKKLQKEILQKHLDINYSRAAALLRNHPHLKTIESSKLEDTLFRLDKLNITKDDILNNPMTLSLHYNTVEHNIMYLKEAGFTDVSAQVLLRFRSIVRKPVGLLKAHGVISEDINVPEKLYSYLTPKPLQFPLLEQFNDEHTIVEMHAEIFKHYLVWRLDSSEAEINRIFKTYDKFKYRSFKLMSDMIRLLIRELKFSKKKLLHQSYLFQVNPQYPQQLLNLFPTIAGTNIKDILNRFPKIIAVHPDSISKIIGHLRCFNVSDESLKNCFDIFTLCPDTVLYRLNEIRRVPEFEALKQNKRFVRLIFTYNKAKLRLDYLQKVKVKSSSINLLIMSDNMFEKYALDGYDTNRGADIVNYLTDVFILTVAELRKLLGHNPHWCQVPLINIQDSLKYLRGRSFSCDEIQRVPVILLYSRNVIKDALDEIEYHPDLYGVLLNSRETLSLCLYFIEKKYHFSGDGVWEDKTIITKTEQCDEILDELPIQEPLETTEEIKNKTLC